MSIGVWGWEHGSRGPGSPLWSHKVVQFQGTPSVNLTPTRIQSEWCPESDHLGHRLGGRDCLSGKGMEKSSHFHSQTTWGWEWAVEASNPGEERPLQGHGITGPQ